MKYLILIIVMMASLSAFAGHGKEGGAGIERVIDGQIHYLTFGSIWKAKTEPNLLKATELPGYTILKNSIENLPIKRPMINKLRLGYVPSPDRRYFLIKEKDMETKLREQIIKDYQDVVDSTDHIITLPGDRLAIFAFTIGKDTYLLDSFFELKDDISKAAILLHEMFRVLGVLDTKHLVEIESSFENWLRNGNEGTIYKHLGIFLRTKPLEFRGRVAEDRVNPNLNSPLKNGILPYSALLQNVPFTKLIAIYSQGAHYLKDNYSMGEDFIRELQLNLAESSDFDPYSSVLQFLAKESRNENLLLFSAVERDKESFMIFNYKARYVDDAFGPFYMSKNSPCHINDGFDSTDLSNAYFDLNNLITDKNIWLHRNRAGNEQEIKFTDDFKLKLEWSADTLKKKPHLQECTMLLIIESIN